MVPAGPSHIDGFGTLTILIKAAGARIRAGQFAVTVRIDQKNMRIGVTTSSTVNVVLPLLVYPHRARDGHNVQSFLGSHGLAIAAR